MSAPVHPTIIATATAVPDPPLAAVPRPLSEAGALYRESAIRLGGEVALRSLVLADVPPRAVDLVITVSSTGLIIPSLEAYLANHLGFRPDVRRLPITERGALSGAAALAWARDFVLGYPEGRVLVIAVELPSAGLPRLAQGPRIASAADGVAAAVLAGRRAGGVRLLDTAFQLFPEAADGLSGTGLRRSAPVAFPDTAETPLLEALIDMADDLMGQAGLTRKDLGWAVLHPGDGGALSALERALALGLERTRPAHKVLRDHGDLSSAAVLFVLDAWLTHGLPRAGPHGLLAAIGPEPAAEMALLQWS
jgi:alkylresorcinol/alkylpyrone synthase